MSEVHLSVNGTAVTLDVEPRLTLADALRHRVGLTGTHVGCEHGVCGACTVLVDGAAVRSCLLFCVQAEGAEITTVEALGEVDDLHPLQEAFRRHHGLQCGFCTPGFLMSAYELLRDDAAAVRDERRLREELSGVLCRCTGDRVPSGSVSPSTVVISAPSALTASRRQERTGAPSSRTVQAPHTPCSQPTWVPVSCRSWRMTSDSSRRAGTWTRRVAPLTVSWTSWSSSRSVTGRPSPVLFLPGLPAPRPPAPSP